jgi:hypothetical protein
MQADVFELEGVVLEGVTGGDSGFPVLLLTDAESGQLVLRAINEGGFSCTDIDMLGVLRWVESLSPGSVNIDAAASAITARAGAAGH